MKSILAGSLIAMAVVAATPVFAQGVFVGPNGVGVGVDLGRHHERAYDDRDRDGYRYDRGYEGRSVYRDGGYRGYRDDDR